MPDGDLHSSLVFLGVFWIHNRVIGRDKTTVICIVESVQLSKVLAIVSWVHRRIAKISIGCLGVGFLFLKCCHPALKA